MTKPNETNEDINEELSTDELEGISGDKGLNRRGRIKIKTSNQNFPDSYLSREELTNTVIKLSGLGNDPTEVDRFEDTT